MHFVKKKKKKEQYLNIWTFHSLNSYCISIHSYKMQFKTKRMKNVNSWANKLYPLAHCVCLVFVFKWKTYKVQIPWLDHHFNELWPYACITQIIYSKVFFWIFSSKNFHPLWWSGRSNNCMSKNEWIQLHEWIQTNQQKARINKNHYYIGMNRTKATVPIIMALGILYIWASMTFTWLCVFVYISFLPLSLSLFIHFSYFFPLVFVFVLFFNRTKNRNKKNKKESQTYVFFFFISLWLVRFW